MNAVLDHKEVSLVDRRTLTTLLGYSAIAKASADLASEVADACADGQINDLERQKLRVALMHTQIQLTRLEAVIG